MTESKSTTLEILPNLTTFKPKFDCLLNRRVDLRISEFANHSEASSFIEYIGYAGEIAKKGKRIRPYLAYLTYATFGGNDMEQAMESFLPLELFHTFSLIHDDIMDKGLMRRGMKTLHAYIADDLKKKNPQVDHARLGNSFAMLIGDLMLAWTHEFINQDVNLDEITRKKIQKNFSEMVSETAQGQAIDLELTTRETTPTSLIDDKNRLKTASTIIRSMLTGVILVNQDTPDVVRFCENFGIRLGMVYQMQDDMLDIQNPVALAKTTFLDITQKQHTYLTQHITQQGTEKQKSTLSKLRGTNLTAEARTEIYKLFTESGAILSVKKLIEKNTAEARLIIDNLQIEDAKKEGFYQLLNAISKRST